MAYIVGSIGSDAGYWILTDEGWKHVGGWGVESLREVQAGLAILKASVELKTPGLANSIAELVSKAIGPELAEHVRGEHTVIIL
jgi:hypothetical protein